MTPEEAMRSKFANDMPADDRPTLKMLLDAIEATAKAEAQNNETQRCADYVRGCRITDGKVFDVRLAKIADDLLRTGGLKVENGSPQTDTPG